MNNSLIGLSFIIASAVLSFSNLTFTGAVIGASSFSYFSYVAIGFLAIGLLLMISGRPQNTYRVIDLESALQGPFQRESPDSIVVDASGAIDYGPTIGQQLRKNSYGASVILPRRIREELGKNPDGQRILMGFIDRSQGGWNFWAQKRDIKKSSPVNKTQYRSARSIARHVLEQTQKHNNYIKLKEELSQHYDSFYEDKPRMLLSDDGKKIYEKILRDLGIDGTKKDLTIHQLKDYVKKRMRVSKGDLDVLASAVYDADHGKKVGLLTGDSHIREAAVKLMEKNKNYRTNIRLINYRVPV